MKPIIYNIPVGLAARYRGCRVIVRSGDPEQIVRVLEEEKPENVQYVQLLSPDVDPKALDILAHWEVGIPVDIVVSDPASEYRFFYNFSKLVNSRAVRVTIAARPGFLKAVKLALALHFAVKLDVGQPDSAIIEEMTGALELYLYRTSVSEPIEYFHSIFLSLYEDEPVNLWVVQEEDPEYFRFVGDNGVETLSPRLAGINLEAVSRNRENISRDGGLYSSHECLKCEFRASCGGYFKWTDNSYDCTGVKTIFSALSAAAVALREDVAAAAAVNKGGGR